MTILAQHAESDQLSLFGEPAPTPARTWADVRPSERFVFDVPGSPWRGQWTVQRIEDHPTARYLLVVDLLGDDGRRWAKWIDRNVPVPGPGFDLARAILGTREDV